jgi:hypothetical protein
MSSIARSFGPATLVHQRQREVGLQRLQRQVQHRMAVHRRHLRLRVHDRGAGLVLHVLARDHGADLAAQRAIWAA